MFDWFKKYRKPEGSIAEDMDKVINDMNNVVQFPKLEAPIFPDQVPYEDEYKPEKPATTYYRLGMTDNGRVSLQMGYSEITMNVAGVNNMIKQLEVFRDQLHNEEEEDNA
jgi:hypothetical protein